MEKNSKLLIITLLFCALMLIITMCSEDIASGIVSIISGEDGRCDYCGTSENIFRHHMEEYCIPCFEKYDGNYWD